KFENVKRDGYRHLLHSFGLVAVLYVGLDELRCRHGSCYALVTPGQKIITGTICCQHPRKAKRPPRTRRRAAAQSAPRLPRRRFRRRAPCNSGHLYVYTLIPAPTRGGGGAK